MMFAMGSENENKISLYFTKSRIGEVKIINLCVCILNMLAQQTGIQFIKASPESGLTSCLDERILAPAL